MVTSDSTQGPDAKSRRFEKSSEAVEVPVEVLRNEKASDREGISGAASAFRGAASAAWESASASGGRPSGRDGSKAAGWKQTAGFRAMAGLALAVAADALELAFPPAWVVIDAFATIGFFLIWGLRWEIAVVLLPELIPGMNVFPSWTLLAMFLGKKDAER